MKHIKILNRIVTFCIVLMLLIIAYFSTTLIKKNKEEYIPPLMNIDRVIDTSTDSETFYKKLELKPGLNLTAIDLLGPVDIDRTKSSYGDAAILEQNNNYLLIDTGTNDENDILINYLKSQEINRLDIYISHYHVDHFGKLKKILKDNYFTVDNIYFPDPEIMNSKLDESKEWYGLVSPYITSANNYINSLKSAGHNVIISGKGTKINVGEATLEVLWDARDATEFPDSHYKTCSDSSFKDGFINFTSLVSMITYKDKKILTCGDLTGSGEDFVLKDNIDVKADIYKFSHHGSSGRNTDAFMEKVNPTYSYYPDNRASNKNITWIGDRSNGKNKDLVDNLTSKTNVFSTIYNGNITYNISPSGEISTSVLRNYHFLTIKYVDEETNKEIADDTEYIFNDKAPYHLGKLLHTKDVKDYSLSSSDYLLDDLLTEDRTFINYYKKKPTEVKNEQKSDTSNSNPTIEENVKEEVINVPEVKKEEEKKEEAVVVPEPKKEEVPNTPSNNETNNGTNNETKDDNNNQSNVNQSLIEEEQIDLLEVDDDEDEDDEEIVDLELGKTDSKTEKSSTKAIVTIAISTAALGVLIVVKLRLRKMMKSSL